MLCRDWSLILAGRAVIDNRRMQTIERACRDLPEGEIWECGVYKGGSALALSILFPDRALRLFDTFSGMPDADPARDWHQKGDFGDTNALSVQQFLVKKAPCPERIAVYAGRWPATFAGLEGSRIAFLHLDGDLYRSNLDALAFVWPRLAPGGVIVNDDYGLPTCPGAKAATDAFFAPLGVAIEPLETGQAVIRKPRA